MRKFLIFLCLCNQISANTSFNWNTTTDLSKPGDTSIGEVVSNGADQAIAIWSRFAGGNWVVETAYSTNNGISWFAPAIISRMQPSPNPLPRVVLNDSDVAIAVFETFDGTNYKIQQAYSADGGQNWTTPLTPLDEAATEIKEQQVALQGEGYAIACWTGVNGVIQGSYSIDGGATWTTTGPLSAAGASSPQVAINIYEVAGLVYEIGGRIQGLYSVEGGATWLPSTPSFLSDITAEKPQIVINDSGMAVAVWVRNDGSHSIIESVYSPDGGATWSSPQILSDPDEDADNPKVCLDINGDTVVVWQSNNGVHTRIQYANSFNGGILFSPSIELSSDGEDSINPAVSINDDGIAVIAYRDSTEHNILTCTSVDQGATFSVPVVLSSSLGDADKPSVVVNEQDYAIALWTIKRGPSYTIESIYGNFFNVDLTQGVKKLLFQKDYVNKIFCDPVPEASLYRVYSDPDLTDLLYEGVLPEFFHHGQKKGVSKTYFMTWSDMYGEESSPAEITGPK